MRHRRRCVHHVYRAYTCTYIHIILSYRALSVLCTLFIRGTRIVCSPPVRDPPARSGRPPLYITVVRLTLPSINLFPGVRAAADANVRFPFVARARPENRVRERARARGEGCGVSKAFRRPAELGEKPREAVRRRKRKKIKIITQKVLTHNNTRARPPHTTSRRHWFSKNFRSSRRDGVLLAAATTEASITTINSWFFEEFALRPKGREAVFGESSFEKNTFPI